MDSSPIEKVWKANADMKLGKNGGAVLLADFQARITAVSDLNTQIEDARNTLSGLLNQRDDAALVLNGLNTRALSAIRGIFGPDSTEYDQAGGTRSSERKTPTRKSKTTTPVPA
jgi:hypothetical protein